jgi:hypothetical protein
MLRAIWSSILVALAAGVLPAQDNIPITCSAQGDTVTVYWGPIQWFVPIQGYAVQRDDERCDPSTGTRCLTILPPEAVEYVDEGVPAGDHSYTVFAINWDGQMLELGSCTIQVPGPGLTCTVEGRTVHLKWQPLMIDVVVHSFQIVRNGELVGSVPGNQFFFDDTVPTAGDYGYQVVAVISSDTSFPIGECKVTVPCFGFTSIEVVDLEVILAWDFPWMDPATGMPLAATFHVSRDGQEVGTTTEMKYADKVPGPGSYFYEVWASFFPLEIADRLVAACWVEVTGSGDLPAPPVNFSCEVPPIVITIWPPPPPDVVLQWINGDDYDSILVLRDGALLVTLPGGPAGEALTFLDVAVPAGLHTYCVVGVKGDLRSRHTCCHVEVPGWFPPPVENLVCEAVVDPTLPPDPEIGDDTTNPFYSVVLRWTDPVAYDKIVVSRNGMTIATLEGTATELVDWVGGGGVFAYDVVGVLDGQKSDPVSCTVEVPPGDVPPPQDLTCLLVDIVPNPDDPDFADGGIRLQAGDPTSFPVVVLQWWNPIRYAGIVVYLDRGILAELPGDAMIYRDIRPPAGRHLYGVQGMLDDGRKSDIVTCWVEIGTTVPPVEDLSCSVTWDTDPSAVVLAWQNPVAYDGIAISRNGMEIAKLPGDATEYRDAGLDPGVYIYEVSGFIGNLMSRPATCQVVIEGPPQRNLLYFSGNAIEPRDGTIPQIASNRVTCLANNASPVQGWSFGVGSDPKFVVPARYDLEGTVTAAFGGGAGPDFIQVTLLPAGLTMAVVIETGADPDATDYETLPPGTAQPLINIEYEAGPSGASGEIYPIRYIDALGTPPVQVLFVVEGFEVRPATLPGWVSIPGDKFLRGDVDGSGIHDITDPINLLMWLFLSGTEPGCMQAADANGSGDVNIADAVYLFSFLFIGGQPPPWPYPECGVAPTPLGCKDPGSCD